MKQYTISRDVPRQMPPSQSPVTLALRALIMLAFIVGIPLIAFNGSSLPDGAKRLLDKAWPTIASLMPSKAANSLPEAPRFGANSPAPLAASAQPLAAAPNSLAQPSPGIQPALLQVGSGADCGQATSSVVPADYQSPLEATNKPSVGLQAAANPFMAMQDRLRQLGATYYLLETWGNQRQFFRFYCQMAVGGNSAFTHYFEATNANPMQAMADVLAQVERWRGGGEAAR
jgi:hypothetical protein